MIEGQCIRNSGVARGGKGAHVPRALGLGAPKREDEKKIKHFLEKKT